MTTSEQLEVRSSGHVYLLSDSGGRLAVRTRRGELLDADAAELLMALGGESPTWLPLVEALELVHAQLGDLEALAAAAEAVGRKAGTRATWARETTDRAALLALAAMGQHHVVQNPLLDPVAWNLLRTSRNTHAVDRALDLVTVLPISLAQDADPRVRALVAARPDLSRELAIAFVTDPEEVVRFAIAANVTCPPDLLTTLARGSGTSVMRVVARNPGTPVATLHELARSEDAGVRAAVAGQASYPRNQAMRLSNQEDFFVLQALAQRTDLSRLQLGWVERSARRLDAHRWRMVRYRISQNPATDDRTHRRLERIERARHTRHRVSKNRAAVRILVGCGLALLFLFAFLVSFSLALNAGWWLFPVQVAFVLATLATMVGALRLTGLVPLLRPPKRREQYLLTALLLALTVTYALAPPVGDGALWGAAVLLPLVYRMPTPVQPSRPGQPAQTRLRLRFRGWGLIPLCVGLIHLLTPSHASTSPDGSSPLQFNPALTLLTAGDCTQQPVVDANGFSSELVPEVVGCTTPHRREVMGTLDATAISLRAPQTVADLKACTALRSSYTSVSVSVATTEALETPSAGAVPGAIICELAPADGGLVSHSYAG